MPHQVRGVVARTRSAPVEVVTVHVPDPGPDEVLIRVEACGVCHTDLHYREGGISKRFPFLLRHEAAGRVEAVGAGVTNVAPGDAVVIAWRAPCGTCRSCLRGRPWYCFDSQNARQRMTLDDGTELTAALGIGAFAELCLVHAAQAVRVDPTVRREAAALIGCGVMAGYGAAVNTGAVVPGDTVAVIGCGGVGNAAIAGAAIAGARMVIAVDVVAQKLEWLVDSARPIPLMPLDRIRSMQFAASPAASAPISSSMPWGDPRRTCRHFSHETMRGDWSTSGSRRSTA